MLTEKDIEAIKEIKEIVRQEILLHEDNKRRTISEATSFMKRTQLKILSVKNVNSFELMIENDKV